MTWKLGRRRPLSDPHGSAGTLCRRILGSRHDCRLRRRGFQITDAHFRAETYLFRRGHASSWRETPPLALLQPGKIVIPAPLAVVDHTLPRKLTRVETGWKRANNMSHARSGGQKQGRSCQAFRPPPYMDCRVTSLSALARVYIRGGCDIASYRFGQRFSLDAATKLVRAATVPSDQSRFWLSAD
jgi:hypothetical protein